MMPRRIALPLSFVAAWAMFLALSPCAVSAEGAKTPQKNTGRALTPADLLHYDLSFTDNESQLLIQGRMDFEHPHFAYSNTPSYRFILDLPYNTNECYGRESMAVARNELKRISIACQPNGKVRFVLHLGDNRVCKVMKKDGGLILTVQEREKDLPRQATDAGSGTSPGSTTDRAPAVAEIKAGRSPQAASADSPLQAVDASKRPLVSCNFFQDDLKEFFLLLAKVSKKPIELSPDVGGQITMNLHDVPWEQALDVVVSLYKLQVTQRGDGLYISPMRN